MSDYNYKKLTQMSKVVILQKVMKRSDEKKKESYHHTGALGALYLTKGTSSLRHLSFKRTILQKGEKKVFHTRECEAVIVLLAGKCEVSMQDKSFVLGPRKSVFHSKSEAAYIIPGKRVCLIAQLKQTEIIMVSAPIIKGAYARAQKIHKKNIDVSTVGKGSYRRSVHTIFNKNQAHPDSALIVGETFNEPGKWSSFPPHKHARDRGRKESRFEEVYFFKVFPEDGFGMIRVYDDKKDYAYTIKNNDAVIVSDGFHPVCAPPGCKVYYFWALASCGGKKLINSFDSVFIK